jgi:hypothetical protein
MNRRRFIAGATTAATFSLAGCSGDNTPVTDDTPETDDEQLAELRAEIDDRGVEYESVELEEEIVAVKHGYDEDPNDAIANVAMAFVDRIVDEWDVERLEGHLQDEGNDWAWHAEAEWAQEYADGEIDPGEYGERLSETMTMILTAEGEDTK